MATIAEQLIEKGEKKGLRGAVLRQLQRRFGPLPAPVRERVEQASQGDLERWLDQVLTASTLAEVLDGAP